MSEKDSEKDTEEMISDHDNGNRESDQHKTVVMLASQLKGILTTPIRARKLRKMIGIFAPSSPFKKLKSNAEVENANMDDNTEMDSANSNESSLQHCRKYISCVPMVKLSAVRSCLIASNGTDATNECCSSQLDSNAQRQNITWHIPIDQKHHFDSSISNTADENIDENMGESDSGLFSTNPTQYENSIEDMAGKESKQGLISGTFPVSYLESNCTKFSVTDDRQLLSTPCDDADSKSSLATINSSYSLTSQTNSRNDHLTNPQNRTSEKIEPIRSIMETNLPQTMRSHIASNTDSETEDIVAKYDQSVNTELSLMVNLRLKDTESNGQTGDIDSKESPSMAELSRTDFTVVHPPSSEPSYFLDAENKESSGSQRCAVMELKSSSPKPERHYKTTEEPNMCSPSGGEGNGGSQFEPVAIPRSSLMADMNQCNFAVAPPEIFHPTYILNPAKRSAGSQNSITSTREPIPTIREIYNKRGFLPPKINNSQIVSHHTAEDDKNRRFDNWGSEQITTPKSFSLTYPSQTILGVTPQHQHIYQPTQTLISEEKRWVRNFAAEQIGSACPIREYPHITDSLPPESLHTYQNREDLVYNQNWDITSEGPKRIVSPIIEVPIFPQRISQPTHIFHGGKSILNIPQTATVGDREPASPIREHNYSSTSLSFEMIPTQISSRQSANSSSQYIQYIPQEISQPFLVQNSRNSVSTTSRHCNAGRGPARTIGEHNYSLQLSPNEMIPTDTLSRQTIQSLSSLGESEFGNSQKWKSYQSATPRSSLIDSCCPVTSPPHYSNPTQSRVANVRDCTSGRENKFLRGNPDDSVSLQSKIIPIPILSHLNHNTACWAATRTDFPQGNEESLRVQDQINNNYLRPNQNQFQAPKISPLVRNPMIRSRKNTLVMPPLQALSQSPNPSWISMDTKVSQPNRESFPIYRYHPYTEKLLFDNRAAIQRTYLPPPSLYDDSRQRSHAISNRENFVNPSYINPPQNFNTHYSKLGAALANAPNMVPPNSCHDQTPGPSNIPVDRRYPESDQPYVPNQESMYPHFSSDTHYDEFGSTIPTKDPKQPRKIRYNPKSRAPKKTKKGITSPNHDKNELNEHQMPETKSQDNSKAVEPTTPLMLRTYYFFTNQNKKFRPTSEQLENELGSAEHTSSNLKVITNDCAKYLAIVEGSASTFKSLVQEQNKNAVIEKLGVISPNFSFINEIVQSFFANGVTGVVEGNPVASIDIEGANEIPTNATCQVAANKSSSTLSSRSFSENEGKSILPGEGSEQTVFPNSPILQDANHQGINLITMMQTDDKLQLILAIHQEPSEEVVSPETSSVIDTLKKEFSLNSTVSLQEVLRIYFRGEESRDELVENITKLLKTEK